MYLHYLKKQKYNKIFVFDKTSCSKTQSILYITIFFFVIFFNVDVFTWKKNLPEILKKNIKNISLQNFSMVRDLQEGEACNGLGDDSSKEGYEDDN